MQQHQEDPKHKDQFSSLSDSERALLKELAAAYNLFKTFSRFGKWLVISLMVIAISLSQLLDALSKIMHYLKHAINR